MTTHTMTPQATPTTDSAGAARACPHTPACPPADAPDASAARIVAEHLQECGYALLCNGRVLMEHGGLLPLVPPRRTSGW